MVYSFLKIFQVLFQVLFFKSPPYFWGLERCCRRLSGSALPSSLVAMPTESRSSAHRWDQGKKKKMASLPTEAQRWGGERSEIWNFWRLKICICVSAAKGTNMLIILSWCRSSSSPPEDQQAQQRKESPSWRCKQRSASTWDPSGHLRSIRQAREVHLHQSIQSEV